MIVRYNETFVDPGAFATDLGDDYYELNRLAASEDIDANNQTFREKYCNDTACTLEHERDHQRQDRDACAPRAPGMRSCAPRGAEPDGALCLHAGGGMPMTLSCPNVSGHVTHISGYNFISFGRPEGECFDETQPLVKSEYCQYTSEEEGGLAADEAVFNELASGEGMHLMASWNLGLAASDPCPGAEKWPGSRRPATTRTMETRSEAGLNAATRSPDPLGLSGQPPLLGEPNSRSRCRARAVPAVAIQRRCRHMGQDGRLSSRLDPEPGTLDERYQHQDIIDENVFMRERIGNEVIVNTTVNTTILAVHHHVRRDGEGRQRGHADLQVRHRTG